MVEKLMMDGYNRKWRAICGPLSYYQPALKTENATRGGYNIIKANGHMEYSIYITLN